MTIEITLLPISCRTLHKVWKFLLKIFGYLYKIFVNISLWSILIFGILGMSIPEYTVNLMGGHYISDYDLTSRVGGILMVIGSVCLMIIIYDIKINLCIKEKPE
mgnify:CR=1 FL=1